MTRHLRPALRFAIVACVGALVVASCSSGSNKASAPTSTSSPGAAQPAVAHPNIVFILTDDLSWNLINDKIAPHIMRLEQQGETFNHYFVADSLCCPSRSSIFTGLFPHDTHVTTNLPPDGGYQKFQSEGLGTRTFAVALHSGGYATSMLGKYLNGYGDLASGAVRAARPSAADNPVPPGWSDWHVANGTGYAEFNFWNNDNGAWNLYRGRANYGVDVINRNVQTFVRQHASQPFLVEAATFAPHKPYTPAPRNANDFPGLTQPRDPSFNTNNVNPPAWLGHRAPLSPAQVTRTDTSYRKRAQSVQAVDKLLADTEATLAAEHLTDKTYIFFSSDNGYHLGQHRLLMGKQTAFDTDIRVPLVVSGPGVPRGQVVDKVVQNIDLAPTFEQLAGATPTTPVNGTSIVPLLHTPATTPWPTVALVEHQGNNNNPADPDFEGGGSNPTTYEAIRISTLALPHFTGPVEAVYVEYADPQHELEYYDIAKDPYEITNIAGQLTAPQRGELHDVLAGLHNCHDANTCWNAALPK